MFKRQRIVNAIEKKNEKPYRSKSDSLLLKLGDNRHVRLQVNERLTAAGKYYFEHTAQNPPKLTDDGTLVQRGSSEYLVRNGKAKVLRRFQRGEYVYTELGRKYFNNHQSQYLVHVPGVIKKRGSQSRGRELMVPNNAFMGDLSAPSLMTNSEQQQFLRRRVEDAMQELDRTAQGEIVLYVDSDPIILDDSRQWTYDVQTTVETSSGEVRTKTVLDRPLGAIPLLSATTFMPECYIEEAYHDHSGNCVAVQLSKSLKAPLEEIEAEIEAIWAKQPREAHWREIGVSADVVGEMGNK